jgi:imidazoleglycerol-phosphate dehydratase
MDLTIEGTGAHTIATSVPFLDHMLTHLAVHGLFDLHVTAAGDTQVDDHHTVEDVGICLGLAVDQALGDRAGIRRYGHALTPMDEALALVVADMSGRGFLSFQGQFPQERVGAFETCLVEEFLRAVAHRGNMTLHVQLLTGHNSHHMAEAIFKGLGHALREACELDPRRTAIPSTKGSL